jgi:hypothetical protein
VKLVSFFLLLLVAAARAIGGAHAFGARCHVVWTEKLTAMKSASADARLDGDSLL